jgi:hypothetical protein
LWGIYPRLLCNFQVFLPPNSDPSGSSFSKARVYRGTQSLSLCRNIEFRVVKLALAEVITVAAPIIEPIGSINCGSRTPEIAERSLMISPEIIDPSGSIIAQLQ